MGAKKTMENCHSLCLSPSIWRRREDEVDLCPTSVIGFGSKDGARPGLLRVEIAWSRSWTCLGPCPAVALSLGTGGWGGGGGGEQLFHLSSCTIFCPGCWSCGKTKGVKAQARPRGRAVSFSWLHPGHCGQSRNGRSQRVQILPCSINNQAVSWAPIPDGSPLPPDASCPC